MFKRILVTGGAGFIGSHFVKYMLHKYQDLSVINLDKLTYAGALEKLESAAHSPRHRFVQGDIADRSLVLRLMQGVDAVVNFAAETHVDRSIHDPAPFVATNVLGTQVLLQTALECSIDRYLQVSTDEVYGTLGASGMFTESSPIRPNSPYSASKASADLFVRAYHETYGLPTLITRCSNNYGPYQYPEKLIPRLVQCAVRNEKLPVYGNGQNVRDWLHVLDHCSAIDLVLRKGVTGEVYNVGGAGEMKNIDVARLILRVLAKSEALIQFVEDRPGHDLRYAIDASKIQNELGWEARVPLIDGLTETIRWYESRLG